MEFDWDESKNRTNYKKHRIRFEEARLIFKVSTSQGLIPEIITMNTVKQRFEKLPSEHLEAE